MKKLAFILFFLVSLSASAQFVKPKTNGSMIVDKYGSRLFLGNWQTNKFLDSLAFTFYPDSVQIWTNQEKLYLRANTSTKGYINTDSSIYIKGWDILRYYVDSISVSVGSNAEDAIGRFNSSFGTSAGIQADGGYNTYIGGLAGASTSGNNSVFLGYKAGYGTLGSNSIYIGAGAGEYIIIDSILLIGSGDTNTSLIYGHSALNREKIRVNGDLYVKKNLYVDGEITSEMPHAFFSTEDTTYTPDLTQNVYTKLVFPGIKEIDYMSKAGDSLQITSGGGYFMQLDFSIVGLNGEDYRMALYINGVKVKSSTITTTGDKNYVHAILTWYAHMSIGDDISLRITNLTSNNDPTLKSGSFYIQKIY